MKISVRTIRVNEIFSSSTMKKKEDNKKKGKKKIREKRTMKRSYKLECGFEILEHKVEISLFITLNSTCGVEIGRNVRQSKYSTQRVSCSANPRSRRVL